MEWKGIVLVPAAAGDSGGDLGAGDISPILAALFGNRTAACVLLFLQSYGEGHAMRIAETFGFGLNMTQRQLKRLEGEGVLLSRRVGNVRLFSFNQRNATFVTCSACSRQSCNCCPRSSRSASSSSVNALGSATSLYWFLTVFTVPSNRIEQGPRNAGRSL
jgi:hypothetical protein